MEKPLCFTSYMCILDVETFPLLVAVSLLDECMVVCIWVSLLYNHDFNTMEFADQFFSFFENFLGDYQLLFDISPTYLSTRLET